MEIIPAALKALPAVIDDGVVGPMAAAAPRRP